MIQTHTGTIQYQACELRVAGHDYAAIADILGTTREQAHALVVAEFEKRKTERDPETEIRIMLEGLRHLLEILKDRTEAGDKTAISETIQIINLWERLFAALPHR